MKIYLAGPISGKGYDEVVSNYLAETRFFEGIGYEVLCPMTGKQYLRNEDNLSAAGYEAHPVSRGHAIFERDRWMVSTADIIFANFANSGTRVSIGTVCELAWGSMLGKHTVSVIPVDNIHNHVFVTEASDIIFPTYDGARIYFSDLMRGLRP